MVHGIQVHLSADIEKYRQGMESAKKMGSDSMGFIASIFDKIKSMFAGLWDSFKSFFSSLGDKFKSTFGSMSESASGAFQKIAGYFPGMHKDLDATKTKMSETEEKSSSLAQKIGIGLVAAFVALTAAVGVAVKKGLDVDAAFAAIAISSDIAASQISRFDAAAARSGMGIKDLGASMAKFREAMTKSAAGDGGSVFDNLGVKVADSNNALLQTDTVLIDVAKKIAGMSSEAEKYAAAAKIGFDGKVQVLEDIAHASELSASTTDAQADATVRLGKIWHEIIPSGKSMWAEISSVLTNSLTPAMTDASVSILESKNRIVDAFNQIYGGGSVLDKLGDKIRDWSKSASTWFAGVEKSSTDMTISIMKFIAAKTGLGNPDSFNPKPGYVPGPVKLVSDKSDPIAKDAEVEAAKQYAATAKAINEKIAAQKLEAQTGEALTEGQRMAIQFTVGLRDGTIQLTDAQKAERTGQLATLISQEQINKQMQDAKAKGIAAEKKEQEAYATTVAAIATKISENKQLLKSSSALTEGQKLETKLDAEIASGKLKLAPAHEAVMRAMLAELSVAEQLGKEQVAQREITKFIAASTAARDESAAALDAQYRMYGKNADALQIEMVAVKAETDMQKQLAALREKGLPISSQIITQLESERNARVLVERATLSQGKALEYAAQLREENKRFGLDYIADDKARAAAQLEIDANMWQERIRNAGEGTDAQKILQSEYTTWHRNQAIRPQLDEQKKMWDSVEQTAHDTFISIFNSGKSAFDRLRDTLKNGLYDLLYQMTLKKWIFNIGASVTGSGGIAGAAQAAATGGTGSAAGSMLGSAAGSGLGITGAIGSIGTGAMQTAGAILSGEIGFGTTLSAGLSAVGTGTASGLMAGMSSLVGALGPIALGIGAVVMLAKSLDHSGTYHTGGAASASSAGVSTIRAEDLHFEKTQTSSDAEKMTAQLASGIVGILDSTALAFGKTAGYTAATAFADDSSKDGAWGALVISKLGDKLIDWQDSRGNGPWAPKVFADGAEGQKQYLVAISSDVRTALNGIGLPDWAQKILDGLGKDAGIDEMAKVVDAINATQKALKVMGDTLSGFSSLSEGAVSALMAAAGGIQNLAAGASAYYDGFYSNYEKNASATKQVADALKAVGLEMPDTNVGFRALVESEMALGEAGAPALAVLFGQAGAYAKLYPLIEKTTTAIEDQAAALQKMKDGASSLLGNVDNAFSVLQRVTKVTTDSLTARITAEKTLSDAIKSTLGSMKVQGYEMADWASGLAQIEAATAIAKAGGPLPDSTSLQNALSAVSQIKPEMFASQIDYERAMAQTQNDLSALGDLADSALSVDQRQLDSLNSMLSAQQQQIDILKGIDVSGLTIAQALAGLHTAIGSAQANPIVGSTAGINGLYQSLLGRAPDAAGMEYWQQQAAGGLSMAQISAFIKDSAEFKHMAGVPGFDNGGDHIGGWRVVGEHKPEIEFTGPSRIASYNSLMNRISSPSDSNSALAAELKELRKENAETAKMLDAALTAIAKYTLRSAEYHDKADGIGTPPVRDI